MNTIERANQLYNDLIQDYKGLPNNADDERILSKWKRLRLSRKTLDAVLYVAAAFPAHTGHPRSFSRLASSHQWSVDTLQEIGLHWYIHHGKRFGHRIPAFVEQRYGREMVDQILLNVVLSAPPESPAYIQAARDFLSDDLATTQIARFRTVWEQLPSARREAIAVALSTDTRCYQHSGDADCRTNSV